MIAKKKQKTKLCPICKYRFSPRTSAKTCGRHTCRIRLKRYTRRKYMMRFRKTIRLKKQAALIIAPTIE